MDKNLYKIMQNEEEYEAYYLVNGEFEYLSTESTRQQALAEIEKYAKELETKQEHLHSEAVKKSNPKRGNPNWKPFKKYVQVSYRR